MNDNVAFIGCSRGLGRAVAHAWCAHSPQSQVLLVARNREGLQSLAGEIKNQSAVLSVDLSKEQATPKLVDALKNHRISRLFYFAGGGPFGPFVSKQWKDHQWALDVCLLTPMKLTHQILNDEDFASLKQIIFVGSMVADNKADPMATSYSSGKHGLAGFVTSLQGEVVNRDLRLFRPGYMNTSMLPPRARPRLDQQVLAEPESVAEIFVSWAGDVQGAKILNAEG